MDNRLLLITIAFIGVLNFFSEMKTEGQPLKYWHDKERTLRYKPENGDFVINNGSRRFNRALYGTNTAFRVEGGDLPEFALYMPGFGGNFKLGFIVGAQSKWIINSQSIIARYRPGALLYEIQDPLLGNGKIRLTLLALSDAEGMILRAEFHDVPSSVNLIWAFGGASGRKFSRDGDLNVDPESNFYLKSENCKDNSFDVKDNGFILNYGVGKDPSKRKSLAGCFSPVSGIVIANAAEQDTPGSLWNSKGKETPVLTGKIPIAMKDDLYFIVQNSDSKKIFTYAEAPEVFEQAEAARNRLAERIKMVTPDPYINNLGATLGIAADAIWESPTWLHGAVGWRMRLNGWRGPYTGDPLGWHDRSRTHFNAYAKSQVTSPDSGPAIPDPEKNLARQQEKMGNALFTSGYICRNPDGKFSPHHYDMNLVYIDALLRHFLWTGDKQYIKEMWPVLTRHLAWEKRNFDGDNDGLYDAYCCIWASDALEYNGSGVAHSTAYNYYANRMAAKLALIIGEDPLPYNKEADKIYNAINSRLWMSSKGWFAEYQDLFGVKQLHPAAALWTIYHTIDSEVTDAFKAYQMTRYVDSEIPHIPVLAKGLPDSGYYVLSTSNWMPYEWSINNVVMAENLHTSLAYWQSGRPDAAFKLWKSTLLDAMYLGGSPGNFVQMSFYDASRGEAYRDFADEIGMASRSLVEGLFGITPNALNGTLTIRPGLPNEWDSASLHIPDISFDFRRNGRMDNYTFIPHFPQSMKLKLVVNARGDLIKSVFVNGKSVRWQNVSSAIEKPEIEIISEPSDKYEIGIEWGGERPEIVQSSPVLGKNELLNVHAEKAKMRDVFDPQLALSNVTVTGGDLRAIVIGENGSRTVFVKLDQGALTWWAPLCFDIRNPVEVVAPASQEKNKLMFQLRNHASHTLNAKVTVNPGANAFVSNISVDPGGISKEVVVSSSCMVPGSNKVQVECDNGMKFSKSVVNWNVDSSKSSEFESIDLSSAFNDKVTQIFRNEYLSPRSSFPTLAIPKQGIGDWCSPMMQANIEDSGIRNRAGLKNSFTIPQGIPFATPGKPGEKNIIFTSQWDNYPKEIAIPLSGSAIHGYFLMAGSTNFMQSRVTNARIIVEYMDGSVDSLLLRNPETWCPIEKDYFVDGYAFPLNTPRPLRVHLKTGRVVPDFSNDPTGEFNGKIIDGGAAVILDLPLNASKRLKLLKLKTIATEVVVGLMGVTLERK